MIYKWRVWFSDTIKLPLTVNTTGVLLFASSNKNRLRRYLCVHTQKYIIVKFTISYFSLYYAYPFWTFMWKNPTIFQNFLETHAKVCPYLSNLNLILGQPSKFINRHDGEFCYETLL